MKQKRAALLAERGEFGDAYTFIGLDADTKLVVSYLVGHRTCNDTAIFIDDLRARVVNRPQITTDAFAALLRNDTARFGNAVDYAQLHKAFASELSAGSGRYSPPIMVKSEPDPILGDPDPKHISTSYVERNNLTIRMKNRRFTRLTNGFSKKLANLKASVALQMAHYDFVWIHRSRRCTLAMAAGVTNQLWLVADLLEAIAEKAEAA